MRFSGNDRHRNVMGVQAQINIIWFFDFLYSFNSCFSKWKFYLVSYVDLLFHNTLYKW
jgi:hypothetical protein